MVNFKNQFRGSYKEDRDTWIAAKQIKDPTGKLTLFFDPYFLMLFS